MGLLLGLGLLLFSVRPAAAADVAVPSLSVSPLVELPGEQQAPPAAIGTSTLVFDIVGPSLAEVQAYTFKHYDDGAAVGAAWQTGTVTCVAAVAAGTYTCTAPFPAYTPGPHAVVLTATNLAGEGPKSAGFSFTFTVLPGVITNIRVGVGGGH